MVSGTADGNDEGMNDTHPSGATPPRRLQDITSVRRPRNDRMLGGVAAGIARWLNIDPVIVRIGFVALTFIGLSGLILYAAGWLFIPSEDKASSPVGEALGLGENDASVRIVALAVAGALALAAVLGDTAWGLNGWAWGTLWVLFWIAVPVAFFYWLFVGRKRHEQDSAHDAVPTPTAETTAFATTASEQTAAGGGTVEATTPIGPPPPPGAQGPASEPPVPPKRTTWSPALFLGTLSVIALTWGGLWLWSQQGGTVEAGIYAASGLGITALGLLIGTRFGNAGLLVPVGLILSVVLPLTAMLPSVRAGDFRYTPVDVEQATQAIDTGAGQVTYDLRDVREPADLAGESVNIRHGVGVVRVIVPRDVDVDIDASMRLGQIDVFGRTADGWDQSIFAATGDNDDAFDISISSNLGVIEVIHP